MRKILFLGILSFACFYATPCVSQTKILNSRHEVKLGVGLIPYSAYSNEDVYFRPFPFDGYYPYYQGNKIGIPAINFSYSYQLKKWLSLGATLTYAGVFQKTYHLYTDEVYKKRSESILSLTPTVRFDWFRTNTVKLYSSVGIGWGYYMDRDQFASSRNHLREGEFIFTLDLAPIGISVGRKFFGFCELSISNIGIIKAGVGYRFNNKSKR